MLSCGVSHDHSAILSISALSKAFTSIMVMWSGHLKAWQSK
ncbi:Uncharacterised protein [Vibrio cholerae]|nr:Uncharacterised protein [Vibrio cholerae]